MRFGALEIAVVIGVIIIIVALTYIGRSRNSNAESRKPADEKAKQVTPYYLKRSGTILVIIGIILLFVWMGLFRWAIWACAWSFAIIVIGLVLFVIGRKHK